MARDSRVPVSEHAPASRSTGAHSNRLALLLGLVAISLTLLAGWVSFQHGRGAVRQSYLESATGEARWYASVLELSVTNKFQPDVLSYLEGNFQNRSGRYPFASLVVCDEQGIVRMHSLHKELVGQEMKGVLLAASSAGAPRTLSELLQRREDWAGFCESETDGTRYLAAFAFPHPHGEFVGLFVPEKSVTLELDRASIPWLLGTLLVALVLMPLALLLLQRNHAHSLAQLAGTEASLRESEARLSSAIESLPCEFWIHGPDGRILLQNAQAVRSAGLRQRRVLADGGAEPEQVRFWKENCARALAGETFEIDYEGDDGEGVRQFHAIIGPVRSAERTLGAIVLKLDVTERRNTERALQKAHSEQERMNTRLSVLHDIGRELLQADSVDDVLEYGVERLCQTLGCSRASILLADRDASGSLLHFRLAAVGGAASGLQPTGTTFAKNRFSPAEIEAYEQGQPVEHTDIARLLDSHPEFVRLYESGLRSMCQLPMICRGKLIGTLNLSYPTVGLPPRDDIEIGREAAFLLGVAVEEQMLGEALRLHAFELEQRVLERTRELVDANNEMEIYVHTVTHDLRAPLRAIQGFGQALVEDCPEQLSPSGRTYVERMVVGAARMDLLMNELLEYSRLGHAELHLQSASLDGIERAAEAQIASELELSAARVVVLGPLGVVRGHTPTLVQVLVNLLGNAVKFVPAGRKPEIRLRAEPRGARQRLWVEDNGIGIPAEAHERIWGVFERLHGREVYAGSGLGLAIVRRALGRMHGTCGVESEPGAGSRFWIELDLVEPKPLGS